MSCCANCCLCVTLRYEYSTTLRVSPARTAVLYLVLKRVLHHNKTAAVPYVLLLLLHTGTRYKNSVSEYHRRSPSSTACAVRASQGHLCSYRLLQQQQLPEFFAPPVVTARIYLYQSAQERYCTAVTPGTDCCKRMLPTREAPVWCVTTCTAAECRSQPARQSLQ